MTTEINLLKPLIPQTPSNSLPILLVPLSNSNISPAHVVSQYSNSSLSLHLLIVLKYFEELLTQL